MLEVVIKGSEWRRGGNTNDGDDKWGDTALLNSKGLMCCLGIDWLACGGHKDDIYMVGDPMEIAVLQMGYEVWLGGELEGNSALAEDAMDINDRTGLTDDERIERLWPIFEEAGRTIVWKPNE